MPFQKNAVFWKSSIQIGVRMSEDGNLHHIIVTKNKNGKSNQNLKTKQIN